MSRLIAAARRGLAGVAVLAAVTVLAPARASAQEGPYEPWIGELGITETVDEIMARDAQTKPWSPEDGLRMVLEHQVNRSGLPQNPDSPAVSRWPWDPNVKGDLDVGMASRIHRGALNPQVVSTSFIGPVLGESGFIPPDTTAAVGPTQIVMFANGRIKVYSKTGVVGGLNVSADSFFTSVRNGSQISDPQVKYDRLSGRWIIAAINVASTNNRIVIAVSSGSTITNATSFTFYFFQQNTVAPAGNTNQFADYPKCGVDANAFYVGCNMFGAGFAGTTGWVVRKSSILSGGPIAVTAFRSMATAAGEGPYAPMGVDNDDPAATEGYFIGSSNIAFGRLTLRRILTPGGTPSISANLLVTTPSTTNPQVQPALGSSGSLDAIDDRMSYCSIHLNRATGARTLWTAHQIEVNASGVASTSGNRNGSRWYELQNLTTTPSLRQSGTLFDPAATNPRGYWFPAIVMSGQGHAAIGSSMAGAADRAQIATAGRLASDTLGTIQAPIIAQTSATAYNVQAGTQRWGDYSQAWVDPTDDQTIWIFQEYCNASNSWAERAIKLLAPPPVTPALCTPATLAQGDTNVNVTVSGTSVSGSAFYDTEAGFNRLVASVSGTDVTVNSVTFSHATTAQFTMNVTVGGGAATGARNVTATNPDGQLATGTGILTITSGGSVCPSFTTQPSPQTACVGGPTSFTVAATGTPAPTFQWRKNGVDLTDGGSISGATTATLSINPVSVGDADNYDCVATNGCAGGPATSNPAGLTVNTLVSFTTQPTPQTACEGAPASFTVAATGTPAPTFQWRKNGVDLSDGGSISGATTTTLTINPVTAGDSATYDCVATGGCTGGPTTSDPAGLTVDTAASISGHPANATGFVGDSRSFSVAASGTGPITYQWRKGGLDLAEGGSVSGSTTPTLTLNPLALVDDATSYDCVVTNPCGSVTTNAATLAVFCRADVNMDGFVDGIDYDTFMNAFESGDPLVQILADYNGDGFVDGIDYDEFMNAFEGAGGC